jgi:hypothetical protein
MTIRRLVDRPIIRADPDGRLGDNVNGPSLIRVPDWIPGALGRYYLYFAHHQGEFIRLAYADELTGPWEIYEPGTLQLAQTVYRKHIASPDVHVVEDDGEGPRLLMFYHGSDGGEGPPERRGQTTRVAVSTDGLHFESVTADIGRPYFRAFRYGGMWYAVLNGGWLYRAPDPLGVWQERPPLNVPEGTRHVAAQVIGDTLRVFFSVRRDAPEHILKVDVDMGRPWSAWRADRPVSVLRPERKWEGAELPVEPSRTGSIHVPVHQLRDPGIFQEAGRTYLLYSVAGENGIGIAEIEGEP